jgi:rod shape determining protein RodA
MITSKPPRSPRSQKHHPLHLFCLFTLLTLSSLCVWSTAGLADNNPSLFLRHAISILLGISVFFAISRYPIHRLQRWIVPIYILMTLLLIGVLLIGPEVAGSRRWFYFGPVSFQPSEFTKVVLILTLSTHLASLHRPQFKDFGLLALHLLLPCALVFKQPDLGTTLMIAVIFLGMLTVSPLSTPVLLTLITPVISLALFFGAPVVWQVYLTLLFVLVLARILYRRWHRTHTLQQITFESSLVLLNWGVVWLTELAWSLLKGYQKQRILSFIAAQPDELNAGYQVMQSKIAVGSGGWFGQGFFQGSQTQLGFVPEQHTDFIFSALGEEGGFFMSSLIVLLFSALIARTLWIAYRSEKLSELYLCTGVGTMLLAHVAVNIGMNLDLLPVTGVPLPLFSYGGSSMLIHMASLGLVESVYLHQQLGRSLPVSPVERTS